MRTPLVLGLALAVIGCAPAAEEAPHQHPPTEETAGSCEPVFGEDMIRLAAGAKLAPGQEGSWCFRWTTPRRLEITGFKGALGPGGHHALLLARASSTEPDGLAPCSEAELMDAQRVGAFDLLAGVSYESSGQRFEFPSAPVQAGLAVAPGTQLIFDAHLHNSGTSELAGCASLELSTGRPVSASLIFRTVLPEAQYSLVVPARGAVDVTYEEPAGGHYRIVASSTHMHEGGKHVRFSIKETGQTLYETSNWANPTPVVHAARKLLVEAGQTFRLECSFENPGAMDQRFPEQMCVGGMYLLPCSLPGAC